MAQPEKKFETPHNTEAEHQVVGSILIAGSDAMRKIDHLITMEDFFDDRYKRVFEAITDLYKDGIEPDVMTVGDRLKNSGWLDVIGGYAELTVLSNDIVNAFRVVESAKIVAKYAVARRLLSAARDIGAMTQDVSNVDELIAKADARLSGVTKSAAAQGNRLALVDLQHYMTEERAKPEVEGVIQGMSTGIQKIDRMTQGFLPGELMIVSGQTSHGKTQLSNNVILNAVNNGHKVMFVTMEMTKGETAKRFNSLTDNQDIGEGKVFLNMRADLAYVDVTKLVERAKENGCTLVVIDHLHYFSRAKDNVTQEVSRIVMEFKRAAVTYEMPILLICHVRKMSPAKHPTIEDLRDSSLIAQDADIVLMVWRDESPNAKNPFEVEVTLWKNRNRQKKHRRDFLYANGLKLEENDNASPESKEEAHNYAAQTARQLGERDDNLDDLEIDW